MVKNITKSVIFLCAGLLIIAGISIWCITRPANSSRAITLTFLLLFINGLAGYSFSFFEKDL